jgi:hypothetical protein
VFHRFCSWYWDIVLSWLHQLWPGSEPLAHQHIDHA